MLLRELSLFYPDVHRQDVTVYAEPFSLGKVGAGKGREAEVIFVLRRAGGEVLLVNKQVYPLGTYRLPTGGVELDEQPHQAVVREIREETGFEVSQPGLLGIVDYTMHWPDTVPARFRSHIYLADINGHSEPRPENPAEIDAYRWAEVGELAKVAAHLRSLPDNWSYWGRFRAASYEFIQCGIMQYNQRTF